MDLKVQKNPLSEFDCIQCGKEFEKLQYLRAHLKSHEANNVKEIIPCSLCDKIYSDKSGLVKHMDSKYPRPENDLCSNIVKIKQTELLIYIFKD